MVTELDGAVPVPASCTTGVVLEALLVKVTLAVKEPLEGGMNFTGTCTDFPGCALNGYAKLGTENAELPVRLTVVTESRDPPVLVTVMFCVPELPTSTLPKSTVNGEADICAGSGDVPDPVTPMFVGLFVASLVRLIVVAAVPVDAGEKATTSDWELPAAIVVGRVKPVTEYPQHCCIELIVVFPVPVFDITTVCVEVVPTATWPKSKEVGLTLNAPDDVPFDAAESVTDADADFVVSACEVTMTLTFAGLGTVAGAVYRPVLVTVPQADPVQPAPATDHVTPVFDVFVTVAVNCCVLPV